jgi:hypothetical protein
MIAERSCRQPAPTKAGDCLRAAGGDPASDALFAKPRLQRHGVSRLPEVKSNKQPKRKFKTYLIGDFHIAIAEAQTAEDKLRLFVAIARYPPSSRSSHCIGRAAR